MKYRFLVATAPRNDRLGVIPSAASGYPRQRVLHVFLMIAMAIGGCRESVVPPSPIPAVVEVVGNPVTSTTVGAFAGNMTVRVKDADGNPLSGILVTFAVSLGAGSLDPAVDTTRSDGSASTAYTVGTVPSQNQLTATASGIAPVRSDTVTAVAGPSHRIAITPRSLRLIAIQNSARFTATVRDSFGNNTGGSVTWASRNVSLVSVTPGAGNSGTVEVVGRPGQTYLVGTSGGVSDSILVSVLDASATPCTFVADPNMLSIGSSISLDNAGVVCLRSVDAGVEYALVAHYGTPASTALTGVDVLARGIVAPASSSDAAASRIAPSPDNVTFESALRLREQQTIGSYVTAARAWFASKQAALVSTAREGDLAAVNVNAFDFCGNPSLRTARVAAITKTAVILADTDNPPEGFTDAEYRAFGTDLDTLVSPVDTIAFGSPTDIDGNGRVAILFTKAVNELTPRGAPGGIALGFFYSRDLLPKLSAAGACPGSNVGEMFYVLVPDTAGVAGDRRSKAFVQNVVVSTIAHEYQHLINAARRLYINKTPGVIEETWLNEGLSHIAEELVFYRASKLEPRQNIGAAQLQSGTATRSMFDTFLRGNFGRYQQYLGAPGLNSPIATEDFVATRGATWAFLRYLADRAGETDGNLWYRIVNSHLTGAANLEAALSGTGLTMLGTLHDWSISVLADDALQGPIAAFQQPSWNFVAGMPAVGLTFALVPAPLTHGISQQVLLRAGGSSYLRFGVMQGQEALVQVTGANGLPIPPGVRLLVVRTK